MKEKSVEAYFVKRVAELGGAQAKHTSPGTDGEPDRIVKLPGCPMAMVELKRPGEEPTAQQWERMRFWLNHGVIATWADSYAMVEQALKQIEAMRPLGTQGIRITLSDADRAAGWIVPA